MSRTFYPDSLKRSVMRRLRASNGSQSLRVLSAETGVSPWVLSRWRKEAVGGKVEAGRRRRGGAVDPDTLERGIGLIESGMSFEAAARESGMSGSALRKAWSRHPRYKPNIQREVVKARVGELWEESARQLMDAFERGTIQDAQQPQVFDLLTKHLTKLAGWDRDDAQRGEWIGRLAAALRSGEAVTLEVSKHPSEPGALPPGPPVIDVEARPE